MTSIQKRDCSQRKQISKAPTSSSFHWSDHNDQDYKDYLGSNKPLARPFQAPLFKVPTANITWYMQKDLNQIVQPVFQT